MLRDEPDACTAAARESIDEHSALLNKISREAQNAPRGQRQLKRNKEIDDGIGPRKLGMVMASVWLGTFCAGLGKPSPIYHQLRSSKGEGSEAQSWRQMVLSSQH